MHWPLFDLRLQSGPVSLRAVTDADLETLTAILPDDVDLDPRVERFPDLTAEADRRRVLAQGVWRSRGGWSPASWCLDLTVSHEGVVVGLQTLEADDFNRLRTVDTASWLVASARGRGIGVAMREAVLGLAFDHLGAVAAVSSATTTNGASLGVSRRLGYAPNGVSLNASPAGVVELQHVRLSASAWPATEHRVSATGVTPCLPWFGVAAVDQPSASSSSR